MQGIILTVSRTTKLEHGNKQGMQSEKDVLISHDVRTSCVHEEC